MNDIAIRVEEISKCYQIYEQPRDRLKQFLLPTLHKIIGAQARTYFREFWALKNISFNIKKGETVGIVGRNGSGKSTLLQIICGTLTPSSGKIHTVGRIAALLELGSGFNPEFTGRENVYMNAAVLGLKKEDIDRRFEDIVAFADIGEFIEQPIKTYSSGMMVRLAFAVAINVDPEILIIDEALSVGDELFQRKCFSKIETIKQNGATILFVSHSGSQIIELCDRSILIDSGEKLAIGPPKYIINHYQKLIYAPIEKQKNIRSNIKKIEQELSIPFSALANVEREQDFISQKIQEIQESYDSNLKPDNPIDYESHGPVIEEVELLNTMGLKVNNLIRGKKYKFQYKVTFNKSAAHVRFGMLIKSTTGLALGGGLSAPSLNKCIPLLEKGERITVEFTFSCHLNPGVYFINAGVFGHQEEIETVLHRRADIFAFRVLPVDFNLATEMIDFEFSPAIIFNE